MSRNVHEKTEETKANEKRHREKHRNTIKQTQTAQTIKNQTQISMTWYPHLVVFCVIQLKTFEVMLHFHNFKL